MDQTTQAQVYNVRDTIVEWAPRVLGAAIILLIAHFLAKAVKWALAKLIDGMPGAAHHNVGKDKDKTVGAQLGAVGYWLVLLLGLIAALNALQLGGIVAPLNGMLSNFLSYIPNIVGAVIIFFVGYLVATLAQRLVEAALQAANLDHWLDKTGLRKLTGAGGLAKAVSTLVFVLIIIPVAIAALNQLQIDAISRPAIDVLTTVLNAIPNILAAAVILLIGFGIGKWVSGLLTSILPTLGFDNALQSFGAMAGGQSSATPATAPLSTPAPSAAAASPTGTLATPGTPAAAAASAAQRVTPSSVVGTVAMVAIILFSAVEAARVLGFESFSAMLQQVIDLGGRVLFGGIIIALGFMIANFLSGAIKRSGQGEGFAATIVKWAAIALATAMGLRFMGLADDIVTLAFGLILGSAAVAAALAFGIGGKETAGRVVDKWVRKAEEKQS